MRLNVIGDGFESKFEVGCILVACAYAPDSLVASDNVQQLCLV